MADQDPKPTAAQLGVNVTEESHPELFATVGEKLAQMNWDGDTPSDSSSNSDDSPETETSVVEEAPDSPVETDEQPEESAAEAATDSSVPTLPASHRRSMKAYDWTDSEIDAALQENPDAFRRTAARMHESRIAQTQEWAELGRRSRQSDAAVDAELEETPAPVQPRSTRGRASEPAGLPTIDAKALKEKYGDDEIIDHIVGPINTVIGHINAVLPPLTAATRVVQDTANQNLEKQVDEFFVSPELKGFEKVYGPSMRQCSEEQAQNRHKVLEFADALIVGAAQQGRALTAAEALELAHGSVSSEFKTQAVRDELRTSVKKRQSSISLKPSKRGDAPNAEAKPRNRAELEARTERRLREVFG